MPPIRTELLDAEIASRQILGNWRGELPRLDVKPIPLTAMEQDCYQRLLADIRRQIDAVAELWSIGGGVRPIRLN